MIFSPDGLSMRLVGVRILVGDLCRIRFKLIVVCLGRLSRFDIVLVLISLDFSLTDLNISTF